MVCADQGTIEKEGDEERLEAEQGGGKSSTVPANAATTLLLVATTQESATVAGSTQLPGIDGENGITQKPPPLTTLEHVIPNMTAAICFLSKPFRFLTSQNTTPGTGSFPNKPLPSSQNKCSPVKLATGQGLCKATPIISEAVGIKLEDSVALTVQGVEVVILGPLCSYQKWTEAQVPCHKVAFVVLYRIYAHCHVNAASLSHRPKAT